MTVKGQTGRQDSLRRRAEEEINRYREAHTPEKHIIGNELSRLVHELRVHQIELEIQNEELLRVHAELEEKHEKYLDLYDFAPVGYFTLSERGQIMATNLTASAMLDMTRSNLIGQQLARFICCDDQSAFSHNMRQLFATGEAQTWELGMKKSGGTLFWASLKAVMNKSQGTPVCRVVMVDISDRKKAEKALVESEMHFRNLANCGQALIWTSGEDKLCNYFNEPWLAFTGRTIEQELDNGWVEGVHADDLDRCVDTYVTAFDRHEPFSMEYRLLHASGEYRWLLDQGTPRFDSQGAFLGYIGHCLDITEQKCAVDEVQTNNARLRSLVNILENTMMSVQEFLDNALHEAIRLNGSQFGYIYYYDEETEKFQLNTWSKDVMSECRIVKPQTCYHLEKTGLWGEVVRQRAPIIVNDFEATHPLKKGYPEGHARLFRFMSVPVFDAERIVAVVGLANKPSDYRESDVLQMQLLMNSVWKVVDQKRSETLLLEANRELQAATLRAQQLATQSDSANRAKSAFLANMSHEIRTPLNGIVGMLQLMECTEPTPEQKEYINLAKLSSQRLAQLLTDILDISRIEADKLVLEKKLFAVDDIYKSIQSLLALTAKSQGLRLEFFADAKVPHQVVGDQIRLHQILFNLVANALKFTERGGVKVDVMLLPECRQQTVRLLFVVSDTGIGIDDMLLKDLFNPFVQGETSYTRKFQGAGLGLSIVRRLVRLMGGTLAVDNAGDGTTFYVSLPFSVSHTESNTTDVPPQFLMHGHGRLRILVAEDDIANQAALVGMLKKDGHEAVAVSNGQEVLERLQAEPFDIVFMDVQMPVMNGLEATRLIRSDNSGGVDPHIPIIALTGYALLGDREKFIEAGMDDYLPKPFTMLEIFTALERVDR